VGAKPAVDAWEMCAPALLQGNPVNNVRIQIFHQLIGCW